MSGIKFCRVCRLVLLSVLCLFASVAQAADHDELKQKLTKRMAEMECPGALVGIFPARGEATRMALGVADVKGEAPMTLDMHMYVGSVLKPFLGTTVLRLAEADKLSLDDPVSKYVENVPAGGKITLRMLGSNRSGLFNSIENKAFQKAIMDDPGRQWRAEEILRYAFEMESYFPPGEKFRYSNTNAVLLGMCIERVTGKPFATVIKEQVFLPLGMKQSGIAGEAGLPKPHPSAYRNGYEDKVIGYGDVFYDVSNYAPAWTDAAGNMYSTLEDLGRAAKPLATGQLLSEASRKEFHHWLDVGYQDYQYGFAVGKHAGGIGHPGDVPGYNAFFAYFLNSDASVVVLTNLSNNKDGTMPAEELAKLVREELAIE